MRNLTLTILMAGCILSGCTMIPEYIKPNFSAAQSWEGSASYLTQAEADAAQQVIWSEFFQSPELKHVIGIALEHNKDLQIVALNIQEARAMYRIQRADLLPDIDINSGGNIQKTSDKSSLTGKGAKSELYTANIGLSTYEIDMFGKVRSLNESALHDYLATKEAKYILQNTLIAETANAYLQLLADHKLLTLSEKTLQSREKTYYLLSKSLENGVATSLDVARAATLIEIARVDQQQYNRFVAKDKNALILLMGIKHGSAEITEISLDNVKMMEDIKVALPSEVLLGRAEIRRAEFELMARNADIGAARAAFFPSITLTSTYGFASNSLSDLFSSDAAGAWSLIPQLTLPIFQGGRNKTNLRLAEIRKDKAIINYERAIQTAFRDVSDELIVRYTLNEQLKAQQRLIEATQQVYKLSDARYKAGIDSFLSILDAKRELYTVEKEEILIQQQRLSNLVNLYKALGGGVNTSKL